MNQYATKPFMSTGNRRWMKDAACAKPEVDPDLFFPVSNNWEKERVEKAKSICLTCPVVEQCLSYALENDETYGIWGGLSPEQLHNLKRRAMRERRNRLYGQGIWREGQGYYNT